jgi:small multidrug resistance pump
MKKSEGLTRPAWVAVFGVTYLLSAAFLALATKKLDVGLAYAIWAGSGMAIIAVVGIFFLGESASWLRLASLALVLVGVVGLKLSAS